MHTAGGQDFNYAFSNSMGGASGKSLTPDNAAVDWMVSDSFRDGMEMQRDDDRQEMGYNPRGYAKYAGMKNKLMSFLFYN